MTGIYKIENLVNHKVYIGQARNINKRFRDHKKCLINSTHINKHLQSAWNKYGEANFKFEEIEECEEAKLTEREQYWINYYGGLNSLNTYNKRDAGNAGCLSEESRHKVSLAQKGKKDGPLSELTKQKISNALKGRPAHNKGVPMTESARIKLSKTTKGRPGKPLSEETKLKISKRLKGNTPWNKGLTKETNAVVAKIAQKLIGTSGHHYIQTEEAKEKIRQANIGRIVITNGQIQKRIYPDEFNFYETQGFYKFTYK